MVAAMTILPVASNFFLQDIDSSDRLSDTWDRITGHIMRLTNTPRRRTTWIVALLTVPPLLAWLLAPKMDFLPQADADGVEAYFSMPEGIPLRTIEDELMVEVIDRLQKNSDGEIS